MYIDYEYYKTLYGEKGITAQDFERICWDAQREIDKITSGIDNVRKLEIAFPVNTYDAESVKRCVAGLVNFLYKLETAENSADALGQYVEIEDGSLRGKVITSVSAGNESISYAVGKSAETAISNATKSLQNKDMAVYQFIASKLSGVSDANGVNLLYCGRYPYNTEG